MRFPGIGVFSLVRISLLPALLVCCFVPRQSKGQSMGVKRDTSSLMVSKRDTLPAFSRKIVEDLNPVSNLVNGRNRLSDTAIKAVLKGKLPDSNKLKSLLEPFSIYKNARFSLRFTNGYASYQVTYRSNSDTPYVEKNIFQHNVNTSLNFIVADVLPFSVSYWGRWTNSAIYRNINDVQISLNATAFAQSLQNNLKNELLGLASSLKDSMGGQMLALKNKRLTDLDKWLTNASTLQKLVETNEILHVPGITYDPNLSQEANANREDSIKKLASKFLEVYNTTKQLYHSIKGEVDSLQQIYEYSLTKMRRFQDLVNGKGLDVTSKDWRRQLNEFGINQVEIPSRYKWLLGIRKFAIGRSPLDMSELTAKNISINGLNFEYNSWYYMAFAAGVINYGFRDFAFSGRKTVPQYMVMGRLGLGQIKGNHLIFSLYEGRKQLFSSGTGINGRSTMNILGYSLEARYQIHTTTYITAELAESSSPDFRNSPGQTPNKLGLSDRSNSAYALHIYSTLPKINLRLEGLYKYTGANFQSFSGFQSNASQKAWYIKADQHLFQRQLRFSLSVRSTDFSNPFVVQQYNSNTIFKSIQATFRRKHWPLLTVGYLPMVQITKVGNQLLESRFQTFNVSYYHIYKIKKSRAATTFVFNRFYNTQTDTGFVYYNASNWYAGQYFYFTSFTTGTSASLIRNSTYRLLVVEQNVQWNLPRFGTLGFGVKINRYNEKVLKMGGLINSTTRIGKSDMLSLSLEKGYLPGFRGGLIPNDFLNVQYIKTFSFQKY